MTRFIFLYFIIAMINISMTKAAIVQKRSINQSEIEKVDTHQPEYEHQIIAWPEEVDPENENVVDLSNQAAGGTATQKPIKVLEQFHNILPNKTEEYKLTLDNGALNYKRIEKKITRSGLTDTVQEGYYSLPLTNTGSDGKQKQDYQIIHYKADANGYKVYTVDKSDNRYVK